MPGKAILGQREAAEGREEMKNCDGCGHEYNDDSQFYRIISSGEKVCMACAQAFISARYIEPSHIPANEMAQLAAKTLRKIPND